MLSIVYFSFIIIFNMIFKTIQLENSCFNFTNGRNRCKVKDKPFHVGHLSYIRRCIQCSIRHTNFRINSNCSKDFECVTLTFGNNTIFQRFFEIHRNSISGLFPTNLNTSSNPSLGIVVINYNITKITYGYINSTINMDHPNLYIYIQFEKGSNGLVPRMNENDLYVIKFNLLYIKLPCDNDSNWATYKISRLDSSHSQLNIESKCPENQDTTRITTTALIPSRRSAPFTTRTRTVQTLNTRRRSTRSPLTEISTSSTKMTTTIESRKTTTTTIITSSTSTALTSTQTSSTTIITATTIIEIETSPIIEQTLYTITPTSSFITTTTHFTETARNISSQKTIQTILFTFMTKPTPTLKLKSTTLSVINNRNLSFSSSPSTTTKPSHLLYILFSLLFVIICVTIAIFLLYYCRQQSHLVDEDASSLVDSMNTGTNRPESSLNESSSLLSTEYNATKSSNKPKIRFGDMFNDHSF